MFSNHQRSVIRVLFVILLGIAGVFGLSARAGAQCENPLFIQRVGTDANVMIVFDNSGSMNAAMYHADYSPKVTYPGDFDAATTYYVSNDGLYTPSDFKSGWPASPSAYLVDSDHGQSGRYRGNYLNWLFYNADDSQRDNLPLVTRVQVAKSAVTSLITGTAGVRFGIMKFASQDGGVVAADIGADEAELLAEVDAITGNSWTPLAETMVDALDYFSNDGIDAPIEFRCHQNFIVVVTDGYPTKDLTVPAYLVDYDNDGNDPGDCQSIGSEYSNSYQCSDHLDDVAKYLFDNDLRSDLSGVQNVSTYAIGFMLDAPILQDTADNGGGFYFNAFNASELVNALRNVLNDIVGRTSSGTGVSVVSTEGAGTNRIYRARFTPGSWQGDIEAFDLPYYEGALPAWKAADKLRNLRPSRRSIYTSLNGKKKFEFQDGDVDDLQPFLNTADLDSAEQIINYVRGEDIEGYRDRDGWKLGDIINSAPVFVGKPAHFHEYNNYSRFKETNENREDVIYAASNDGQIHCFQASTGKEMWAYIPNNQLGKLRRLMEPTYCHQYFVNLTPKVFDAHVNRKWRTVLLCGQREGGSGYTALDVTNPQANTFDVMWDVEVPLLKQSWAVPQPIRDKSSKLSLALVGSGPDETLGEAHLVALNLADGSVYWSDLLGTPSGQLNKVTSAVAVDLDFDGFDDLAYVGDLTGKLWRYDLSSTPWQKTLLFNNDQPIEATPVLSTDELGNILVYFGTGRYIVEEDIDDTSQQTFYCVIDDHSGATVTPASMVDQTYTFTEMIDLDEGWYINLVEVPGERVTSKISLVGGTVYFTSFQPATEMCQAGGSSWLYAIDFLDGSAPDNDDGTENDTTDDRTTALGEGIYSEPVLDLANEDIILQSSDTKLRIEDARGNILRMIVRSWRQIYD
jgi:type IV pilus assembly protein PilY1